MICFRVMSKKEEKPQRDTTIQISEVNLKVEEIKRREFAFIVFDALLWQKY